MCSSKEYEIVTVVSAILIAGVLTLPLTFSHQSVDATNVKVKSMKNTIKNKIQALTRVAVTGNDGISSEWWLGTGTNGNPGSRNEWSSGDPREQRHRYCSPRR